MEFVQITNDIKNACEMCKKDFNPLETHCFSLKGHVYCVCKRCAIKIENFIKESN